LSRIWLVCALFALAGCNETGEGEFITPVESVEVVPDEMEVVASPGAPVTIQYIARVTRKDGSVEDLTDVGWESSNLSLGAFDPEAPGLFLTTDATGGISIIRATYLGVTGEASLTVDFHQTITGSDAPEGAAELFEEDPETGSEDAPRVIYPYDQVRIPRNTPQVNFMIEAGEVCTLFHLRFTSATTQVDVYTTDVSYIPDDTAWNSIAANNAGAETLVELTGIAYHMDGDTPVADSAPIAADETITMHISRLDAEGSIYYWAATNTGVYRIEYGEAEAQSYYGVANYGHCVSCHALSPDGTMMAVTYDGHDAYMGLVMMDDPTNDDIAPIAWEDEITGNFKTFSPDSSRLLVTYEGILSLYDTATGEWLSDIELELPATQPNWSPRGDKIAVVLVEGGFRGDYYFNESAIALLDVDEEGNISDEPTIIVQTEADTTNYYPAFSPEGDWIAFNRSWNSGADGSSFDSYDDVSATLFVVSTDGETLYELEAANGISPENGEEGFTNSWPGWAPLPDADIAWLTFSSKRDYGFYNEDNHPQIWVTGFDILAAGEEDCEDPSSPPFWLPYQDPDTNNHIPQWGPG